MSKETTTRVQFRPIPYVQEIHQAQDRDPAFQYKNVIISYKTDPQRVQRYLAEGWEIVQSTTPNKDDRSFTPNSKEEKLRPQMCVETTTDGHEQILMKILKSTWESNQLNKKGKREQQLMADAKRRGDKITRRGNEIITSGTELFDGLPPLAEEL